MLPNEPIIHVVNLWHPILLITLKPPEVVPRVYCVWLESLGEYTDAVSTATADPDPSLESVENKTGSQRPARFIKFPIIHDNMM